MAQNHRTFTMRDYETLLKFVEYKGKFGAKEIVDSAQDREAKTDRVYELVTNCQKILIVTGAGISTSAGIPDYRGSKGIFTLAANDKEVVYGIDINAAKPTFAHRFLTEFQKRGKIIGLITLNLDNLHQKAKFPTPEIVDFDGNLFKETCNICRRVAYRDQVIPSVGYKETGRLCGRTYEGIPCTGKFVDSCIDWSMAYPSDDLKKCYEWVENCELLLCIGTSLSQEPTCDFPEIVLNRQNPGYVVTINLQPTSNEVELLKNGGLALHADIDSVFRVLADKMEMYIPEDPIPENPMNEQVDIKMEVEDGEYDRA